MRVVDISLDYYKIVTIKRNIYELVVTTENGSCVFEHRFVEYNKERASVKLAKREFQGAKKLAGMLLNPTVRHF